GIDSIAEFVDPGDETLGFARHIDRQVGRAVEKERIAGSAAVKRKDCNQSRVVDRPSVRVGISAGYIEVRVLPFTQKESVFNVVGVEVSANNLTFVVDALGQSRNRFRIGDVHELSFEVGEGNVKTGL